MFNKWPVALIISHFIFVLGFKGAIEAIPPRCFLSCAQPSAKQSGSLQVQWPPVWGALNISKNILKKWISLLAFLLRCLHLPLNYNLACPYQCWRRLQSAAVDDGEQRQEKPETSALYCTCRDVARPAGSRAGFSWHLKKWILHIAPLNLTKLVFLNVAFSRFYSRKNPQEKHIWPKQIWKCLSQLQQILKKRFFLNKKFCFFTKTTWV